MSKKKAPLIYLASPYSSPMQMLVEMRFDLACKAAGYLMEQGHHVFSPIAHTHPIAVRCDLPKGWDFWERYDRVMLAACDELWVLMLPGWEESKGIAGEVLIAQELSMPVKHLTPEECGLAEMHP